jgi:hypothetical protein
MKVSGPNWTRRGLVYFPIRQRQIESGSQIGEKPASRKSAAEGVSAKSLVRYTDLLAN